MNKVILVGRLTRDPEIRYSQGAEPLAIARFTLAVNRRMKKEGEPDADFIFCTAFGKQAEFAERYVKKGMQLAVSGRLSVRSYDDPATGQRRWSTEVLLDELEFTESRSAFEARAAQGGQDSYAQGPPPAPYMPAERSAPAPRQAAQPRPPAYEPEGFSAITESIDDDDLPF